MKKFLTYLTLVCIAFSGVAFADTARFTVHSPDSLGDIKDYLVYNGDGEIITTLPYSFTVSELVHTDFSKTIQMPYGYFNVYVKTYGPFRFTLNCNEWTGNLGGKNYTGFECKDIVNGLGWGTYKIDFNPKVSYLYQYVKKDVTCRSTTTTTYTNADTDPDKFPPNITYKGTLKGSGDWIIYNLQ